MFYDIYIGYGKDKEEMKGQAGTCLEDRVS